ncbi:hypothetical protein MLD38_007958 [Melastoma candidum]|uniref:Uncharacterized protein n=1 Tax=Melastoma candidum TaxID=119954 RepID=A0ACB9RSH2_9MYRT|nr:hypothetical protein MLD38_007958 [Melastoma candidum]
MAIRKNLLFVALVFSFVSKGIGSIWDCTKDDIVIRQQRTGKKVHGKPEFSVYALNACPCFQDNVILDCTGFQTVQSIDPREVAIRGNQCLLVNGSGLVPYSGASFYYAWDTEFPFKPLSAHLSCSSVPKV